MTRNARAAEKELEKRITARIFADRLLLYAVERDFVFAAWRG